MRCGMTHKVAWTKKLTEQFIEMAMLNDDEAYIMRSRVQGKTVVEQSMYLNKSVATVHRMIKQIKIKYDRVQLENPDIFPKRRVSKAENYMDNH